MKSVIFIVFLFLFLAIRAQDHYVFSPISSIHGLSDNRVRTICQLPDKRMIFVTEGLVNIYDGATFRYMHYDEQLAYTIPKYSGFHRAYVDNENHLWLKNQYKLMLFDIRTEKFLPNADSVLHSQGIKDHVANLFIDTEYNTWYLTECDELFFRNHKSKKTTRFFTNISTVNGKQDQLYEIAVRNQLLFLFYKSGVMVCYDSNTRKELYRDNPFGEGNNQYASTLMVVPSKHYIYHASNGFNKGILLRFNIINRQWEKIFKADYWLNTLTIDNKDNCWISSFSGLWFIDGTLTNKRLISPLQMVDGKTFESEISTQYNDNSGGLWVGTVNRGIMYYHPDRFKFRNFGNSFFDPSGMQKFNIYSFAEHENSILVGTQNGLFQYDKNKAALELSKDIPANASCEMLKKDIKQRVWVCTSNMGLFCIEGKNVKHYPSFGHCLSLYEASDGLMYLCTSQGVGVFNPQTAEFIKAVVPKEKKLTFTYQLTSYRQDTLLGYSVEGLFLYNRRTNVVSFPGKRSPLLRYSNHHYHCLFTGSRGSIWIGTMDGLNVFNPSTNAIKSFFEEDGLINNSIRSITEDNLGRIWVSTSNGISCISISSETNTYTFTNYNRFDGVIGNEFMPRSVLSTSDNRILWGGLDGFNEIDLNRIDSAKQRLSKPLFTKFLVSGTEIELGVSYEGNIILKQSISATREISLKYFQNFFGLEFSALNYVNPTQTYYRFKLEGTDNAWQEIKPADGIGRVNYTNLSPGTYKLKVYAANNNRQWSEKYAQMTIVIHPPLWKTTGAYFLYTIIFVALLYLAFSYYLQRNKLRVQKQQKEELDQMKFAFFTNISHELRTPLTLILTPLDSILKKTDDIQLKAQLTGIYRNAAELLKMVNQLLDFRKLEIKGETLQLSYCNVSEFLETIVYSFNELKTNKEIDLTYECNAHDLHAYIDTDKLQKIANNLLSNALKFTPPGGKITLRLQKETSEPSIKIQVSDTGCGIPEVDMPQIFDRFYQVKNQKGQNAGSGIGLHLLKEYVVLHNGTVEAVSRLNEGSIFTVAIPSNLQPEEEPISRDEVELEERKILKLLVVEDNSEFRTFLQNELSGKYKVIVAANGNEGLEKACMEHPDLVISDVMMPVMSGTELCHALKNDIRISHIPVILLTAKASDQAQIEGFEAGADAYITKPFNMDILLLRINLLIEQQQKRKEDFKKAYAIKPEFLTSTSVDEILIKKALNLIEKNMDNALYSVDQLSKDMSMERTGLYRKLSAIVGQTPTEFIRSIRMKRAAQLLESGLSVSEVAEKVGFQGTTSYFAKCFQDAFGVKPSQFRSIRKIN